MIASRLAGCVGLGFWLLAAPGASGQPPPGTVDATLMNEGCAVSTLAPAALPPVAGDDSFPTGYQQSRERFRADCAALQAAGKARCESHTLAASRDPDLTVDTAFVRRDGNPHLLVLQSGLHGVEAFAGAAVQRDVMARQLDTILGRGLDVLFIHAVNPWGFKNLRRVDGCNVDLNRSFPRDGVMPAPPNPSYEKLRDITEDPAPVNSVLLNSLQIDTWTVMRLLGGMSVAEISEGTHAGQHVDPAGFEFGGLRPAGQVALLRDLLSPLIGSHAGRIYFLDLHTGLGPANELSVFSGRAWYDPAKHEGGPLRYEALEAFLKGLPGTTAQTAYSGPFETVGDVIDFVPGLAVPGKIVALTLEWGTVGESTADQLTTNARMLLEHRAHFRGCDSATTCLEVKRNFVALFNPEDAAFRAAVHAQAAALIERLTDRRPDFLDHAAK
jgi:predicted deacylase